MFLEHIPVIAAIAALMTPSLPAASPHVPSPTVPSSFISAGTVATWDSTRWGREFRDLNGAGISELVLDGVVVDGAPAPLAYYPSHVPGVVRGGGRGGAPADVITPLLEGARTAGIQVWLGTYLPGPDWYSPSDSTVDEVTEANASVTAAVLRDLDTTYSSYSDVIAGWYLGSEISASYAWSWKAGTDLIGYFRSLTTTAKSARTATRTMVAPYFNVDALPVRSTLWTSMWTRILSEAPVDVLALQDGTGDTGTPLSPEVVHEQLAQKFGDTRAAIAASGANTELWADLDLYDVDGTAKPIDDVAAVASALRGTVSKFTSWSFSQQYSPWTLGTDSYAKAFGEWNNSGMVPLGSW